MQGNMFKVMKCTKRTLGIRNQNAFKVERIGSNEGKQIKLVLSEGY